MSRDEKSPWTAEDMRELGVRHATAEADGRLEDTMATVVEEPIYEFWPIGLRMRGRAAVRRYYEHLIANFMPSQLGYELIDETISEMSLSQEYVIRLRDTPDGAGGSHRVIGVLFTTPESKGLLEGERIWGSEEILSRMVGPVWSELEKIED